MTSKQGNDQQWSIGRGYNTSEATLDMCLSRWLHELASKPTSCFNHTRNDIQQQ